MCVVMQNEINKLHSMNLLNMLLLDKIGLLSVNM